MPSPSEPSAPVSGSSGLTLRADCDGFPWLELPPLRLQVALWPLTKYQLERYLADPPPDSPVYGDEWYEALLRLNERVSVDRLTLEQRERAFATGLEPDEALLLAKRFGPSCDLPTVSEWRAIERLVNQLPFDARQLGCLRAKPFAPVAARLAARLWHCEPATHWGQFMLLRGGVIEWVCDRNSFVGLGKPRPVFVANTLDPQRQEFRRTITGRIRGMGARFICRVRTTITWDDQLP
jgi:hypothetical protein